MSYDKERLKTVLQRNSTMEEFFGLCERLNDLREQLAVQITQEHQSVTRESLFAGAAVLSESMVLATRIAKMSDLLANGTLALASCPSKMEDMNQAATPRGIGGLS